MVGPTADDERRLDERRLALAFVGFVGASAAFTAVYGGATLPEVGLVALVGVGTALAILVVFGSWR